MEKITFNKTHKGNALIKFLRIATLAFILLIGSAEAAPFAYIPDNSNHLSVIDTATDKVVETVNVGSSTHAVAVNPAGTKVYLVGRDEVHIIDTATNSVTGSVEVGSYAYGIAINPAGTKAYVTNEYSAGSVYVIDTKTNTVLTTIPVGYYPKGIAVNPAGTKVYVANVLSDGSSFSTVSVIDTATDKVTNTIQVGKTPIGIAFDPAGTKAYVANSKSGNVSVIDTATETVIATIPIGSSPYGIAVNPAGTRVYVTDDIAEGTVSVIDTATYTVITTIRVGTFPNGIAVNPDGTKVYATNTNSYNVSVIDATTNKLLTSVDVGVFPHSLGQFIGPAPSSVPTVTKKVAVIPAKFKDTESAPSIEDIKRKMDLVVNYYNKQSYGQAEIKYEIIENKTSSDGWFNLSDLTSQFEDIINKDDNVKKTKFWLEACTLAGVSYYANDRHYPCTKDYDAAVVLLPADFTSQAYSNSGYAICEAKKDYGNWAHELGHALFNLTDKAGRNEQKGDIYEWGLMGLGHALNPPAPIIGFDKNVAKWLQYKDIDMSNIATWGNEYTITYLDDPALYNERLLRLSTGGLINKYSTKYFIFEGRRKYDGVTKDIASNENYPLFNSTDTGLVIYNVDGNNKIWREASTVTDFNSIINRLNNNDVTISPGESKYLAYYTLKATCFSEGDKLKIKIAPSIPINFNVWSITTTITRPLINNLPSVPDDSNPDIDLHAITSDGRRIGMDYVNNTYYNEIEGAETSGNLLGGGPEWIAIPDDINVTAYVTISPDMKSLLLGNNSSNVEVNSVLIVYDENGTVKESESVSININSNNLTDQYAIPLVINNSPDSITNLQSTNGTSWINWTWINPTDPDFNHTEIYLNGTFQTNTSAEYFNATGLQPETDYIIGTRTVDIDGNVNETWVNATAKTLSLPDTTFPVIESVVLSPTSTTTDSTINVTVNATDNIGVIGVNANDIPLINQGGSIWNGSLTVLEGTHYVNVSAEDAAKNIAWNNSTSYTAVTPDILPPSSIANLQSNNGTAWINWTWKNPPDLDFDHVEIYLNGTLQTNTSAEHFNATGLEPDTSYTIGTRTVDKSGNINETWVNSSAKTKPLPDTTSPVINSVFLFPANTTAGSTINVTVNATDNIGVVEVTAGDVQLTTVDGLWRGSVTAPSSTGKYSLLIDASDAAENSANASVPYSVVRRQGRPGIGISPEFGSVVAGKSSILNIKVKNNQNVDDTFRIQITNSGYPSIHKASLSWFNWTEKTIDLRAKQEIRIPVQVNVPAGITPGVKLFKASVNSERYSVRGSSNGYLILSRSRSIRR